MSIHIAPVVLHARFYPDNVDVEKPMREMGGGYLFHSVIVINDLGVARIEGLEGINCNRTIFSLRKELINKLKPYGVIKIEWRHEDQEHEITL